MLRALRRSTAVVLHRRYSRSFLPLPQRISYKNCSLQFLSRSFSEIPVNTKSQWTEEHHDRVVAILKARCNALYDDNEAYVDPSEALKLWLQDVQKLLHQYGKEQLHDDIQLAYESGVAIASKQKQFNLALELTQQLQSLGFRPSERHYQYLIRNVALRLIAAPRPTPLNDLRELLQDKTDDVWEREIMTIVEREERLIHLKTESEYTLFHQRLITGIEAQLDEYERTADADKFIKSAIPYNEALRVYANNGIAFSRMVQLMVARNLVVDVETYEALLLGARWKEIPATLAQLLDSKVVNELTTTSSPTASEHVHLIWANAMKAIIYSSTERFNSLSADVDKRDVDQLQKIFTYVNKQLACAFPKFNYSTTEQYEDVYRMRIKAAAVCGIFSSVKKILDEYLELYPGGMNREMSKEPFLTALEVFPWALMNILMLKQDDFLARTESNEVAASPRVQEIGLMYDRIMRKLTAAMQTVEEVEYKISTERNKLSEDELHELQEHQSRVNQIVEYESRRANILEQRLDTACVLKANQLLIKESLERADNVVEYVTNKLAQVGFEKQNDLDVCIRIMEQYMKSARRFDKRLTQRQQHVSPHIMYRVFKHIQCVSDKVRSGTLNPDDPETRKQLTTLFEHAICAAVRFWREEETDALVRQQQRLLGTQKLSPSIYEELIFQRVTNLDVRGAHSLLQEMYNAGIKPSQESIHRIALGLLHRHSALPNNESDSTDEVNKNENPEEAEEVEDTDSTITDDEALDLELSTLLNVSERDVIEKELELSKFLKLDGDDDQCSIKSAAATRDLLLGSDEPTTIGDLIGFFQEWYNLSGVKPIGKTVVPVFAHLLNTHNFPEFRRLLQILESMEGGLTPATQLWLEKRLDNLGGKTLDDFRLKI